MEKKPRAMRPIGRIMARRVQRTRRRTRAELIKPGEKIVRADLGVVSVLKVMETGGGYVALLVARANGRHSLLKIHPSDEVLLHTERIL